LKYLLKFWHVIRGSKFCVVLGSKCEAEKCCLVSMATACSLGGYGDGTSNHVMLNVLERLLEHR
jgi:hypothetical protein